MEFFNLNINEERAGYEKDFFKQIIQATPLIADQEGDLINLHSARVAILASTFASEILESNRSQVFIAGLFHDIGAIGSNVHPLRARSLVDHYQNAWLANHPIRASQVLRRINILKPAANIVLEHHEWFDGGGFPFGKRGADILPEAQTLRIVDSYDSAMIVTANSRVALSMLERAADKEFDLDLFQIFRNFLEQNDFNFLWEEPRKVLDYVNEFWGKVQIGHEEDVAREIMKVFELRSRPIAGHIWRVREIVRLICEHISYFDCETPVRAATIHEMYTTYEPFQGSFFGSLERRQVLENYPLLLEAFIEFEEDPTVSEMVNVSCAIDKKIASTSGVLMQKDIIETLASLSGRTNPEILLAVNKIIIEEGDCIYSNLIRNLS